MIERVIPDWRTGLGLSITYDIVTKAHGGAFTEFVVTLPRHMFADGDTSQ